MALFNSLRLPALLLICLGLTACGDDACEWQDQCDGGSKVPSLQDNDDQVGGGGSSSGGSGAGIANPLDCTALDRNKVYIQGPLGADNRHFAIADPADPTSFCVAPGGFPSQGYISKDGRYLFEDSGSFYWLVPDSLSSDAAGWIFPDIDQALANDEQVADSSTIGFEYTLNEQNELFYQPRSESNVYRDGSSTPYFVSSVGSLRLLAALSDGGLVMASFNGFLFVSGDDLTETAIAYPGPGVGISVEAARLVGDKYLDVVVYNGTGDALWRLDLTTLTASELGLFSPVDDELIAGLNGTRLDGDGNLWQVVHDESADQSRDQVLVRRVLNGDASDTEVIYHEMEIPYGTERWQSQPQPWVHLARNYALITGAVTSTDD